MSGSSKARKLLLGGIMAVLLVSVFFSQRYLNQQREVLGLTRITPLENAPPVLAFTTKALGGFRGLIANALWIRANELQEEGKYFEMVQLADWITKLQPNLSSVWIHLAWNMAYNISVKLNDPEDRWKWVRRGTELLRDEGLRYNPKEPQLYRELAWFFQHKMGHYLDDAHQHYKYQWAHEMMQVLGKSGRPNWDELLNPSTPEQRERVQLLREYYKMDPQWMKLVDERYGPLEWRLPESHAIYWAVKGLELTKDVELRQEDLIGLRRVIFQSLQLAFMRGRLIFPNKAGTDFLYGPNLEIVKQTSEAYLEQAQMEPDKRDNILNAHKNFLGTAVYHLYTHNRKQAAQQWFDTLKRMYPAATTVAGKPVENLEDFALARIGEDIGETDVNRVKTIIMGAFETAFLNYALADADSEVVAVNHELFARRVWQRYQQAISSYEKNQQRVGLPSLPLIREETLKEVLSPEYGLDPLLAAHLRSHENLPADWPPTAPPPATNAPPSNAAAGSPRPASR
jgi:hypothetical protein